MSPITQTVPTTPIPVFVNTPVPTATDDSNQTPTVTVNGLPANNLFPEGSTDIVYTFTDGSGNEASCAYTVIIGEQSLQAFETYYLMLNTSS